jgi:ribosomal protein S18 acetylase RimI-like enzyme
MRIRDVRRADTPSLFSLMVREFPEESRLLGGRPEEFEKIVRRALRWDTRFLLELLWVFRRPVFRLPVVEEDGKIAGMVMLGFSRVSTFVSTLVVDPAYRRRGFAKALLEEGRRDAERFGKKYLVLGVLETNTGARALYDSLGYLPFQRQEELVLEPTDPLRTAPSVPPPGSDSIRPFRRADTAALVEIARRQSPPKVEEVLPTTKRDFLGFALANRVMATEEAAWVIDRGHGAEAHVSANVSKAFEAAHMSGPVVSETVSPDLTEALVRTAGAWCAARNAPRILSMVADHNPRGRAALEAAGFRHVYATQTLYRPVA